MLACKQKTTYEYNRGSIPSSIVRPGRKKRRDTKVYLEKKGVQIVVESAPSDVHDEGCAKGDLLQSDVKSATKRDMSPGREMEEKESGGGCFVGEFIIKVEQGS